MYANKTNRDQTLETVDGADELRRQILLDWKADIDTKRQEWQRLLSEADEQIASIDILLQGLPSEQNQQIPLDHTETPELVSGNATCDDIKNCRTQEECVRAIAKINGGEVYLGSAAKLIEAVGKGKHARTITSTLHHKLSDSDDWEKVDGQGSTFRLINLN